MLLRYVLCKRMHLLERYENQIRKHAHTHTALGEVALHVHAGAHTHAHGVCSEIHTLFIDYLCLMKSHRISNLFKLRFVLIKLAR